MLVGPDGKLCTRWRYFEFDQGKPVDDHLNLALAKAMGHPTPMLETLVLKNMLKVSSRSLFVNVASHPSPISQMSKMPPLDGRSTAFPRN
ncbi:hypothetical protein M408DRAFT_31117 [Serendipita vermifera MAFF 305830]|uniref:Uncharacterized protein n=1 Tax=Serendipita vermifera MAFF 305830 TaxID=933852 RepID=A0A0C3AHI4_SERVB|nr:hypothetical protein M408DRAFT_31117 [Serendipita vermifera MAFF 305830]